MAVIDLNNLIRPKQQYNPSTQVSNVVTNNIPVYTDLHLDLDLEKTVGLGLYSRPTNDILVDNDITAIKNSLRNIFTTKKGQKILNPDFGLSLEQYLFQPITNANAKALGTDISTGISRYEPRITVSNIVVNPMFDLEQYYVSVYYTLLEINQQNVLNIIAKLGGQVLI
jgi:uncharacterized protein